MLPHLTNTFRKMHLLSDLMTRDMQLTFSRNFPTFDTLDNHDSIPATPNVDENTFCKMKVMVNDNGHVKVKTALKEPGKEWDINVKEYNRQNPVNSIMQDQTQKECKSIEEEKESVHQPPFDRAQSDNIVSLKDTKTKDINEDLTVAKTKSKIKKAHSTPSKTMDNTSHLTKQSGSSDGFHHELAQRDIMGVKGIQNIFDIMNKDFETTFQNTFDLLNPFYNKDLFDPEHTFYKMKSVVNNNGHVKVKEARKEPGKDWDVKVKEYNNGHRAIDKTKTNVVQLLNN